jgi:hypothetical protein
MAAQAEESSHGEAFLLTGLHVAGEELGPELTMVFAGEDGSHLAVDGSRWCEAATTWT